MGLAIHSTLENGLGQTTLEFKISLVRPITTETGPIRAEGTGAEQRPARSKLSSRHKVAQSVHKVS
jgi:acyl-coenzyme A thioesterase PaaI-like protein